MTSVDDNLVGYVLTGICGAVAVGLRLALVLLPLDLAGRLGRVVRHGDLLLLGEFAGHLLKLFDAGKLVDVFQAEAEEEILCRFIQNGTADDLFAACRSDELACHQAAQNAARINAANLGYLGCCDRLLVGDDCEGFESLQGELQRGLQGFDEATNGIVILGLGGQTVTTGDLADLEAAIRAGVVGNELIEDGAEIVAEAALLLLRLASDLLFVFFFRPGFSRSFAFLLGAAVGSPSKMAR